MLGPSRIGLLKDAEEAADTTLKVTLNAMKAPVIYPAVKMAFRQRSYKCTTMPRNVSCAASTWFAQIALDKKMRALHEHILTSVYKSKNVILLGVSTKMC